MKKHLKAQNRIIELVLDGNISTNELERISKSELHWADNRKKPLGKRTVRNGEIFQFDFGKNYRPEMSYEHRGLVIGRNQKLLYVLPIYSYDPSKHTDVFHPEDNPFSKSNMFLLKTAEFTFILRDSVLKLNDIRTVSINRILYKHQGRINPSSDTYKLIEALALQKIFPRFAYSYNQNTKLLEVAAKENKQLKDKVESLQNLLNEIAQNE